MPRSSRFQTVSLNTNGSSYESRSIPLSAQRSFNLYPEVTPQGMSPTVMHSWPGLIYEYLQFNTDLGRGAYVFNGELYSVYGDILRKHDSQDISIFTDIGNIAVVGSNPVSISDNGSVMLICGGSTPYQYDGSTLSVVSGVDFNPTKVQFLNEKFYLNGDDGGLAVSDVLSTNFDAANVFFGRSTPDKTITHYIFNQIIYLFDPFSIEPLQDVSVGAPPVSRINQGIIEGIGCSSVDGVTSTDSYMYFMGHDGHAYRVTGFSAEDITNTVISDHFRSLNQSKVYADSVSMNGDKFIIFTFTEDSETWVFSERSKSWFEVGTTETRYQCFSFVFFKNKWVAPTYQDSSILSLETDYYLTASYPTVRERIISTISGDDIGKPGVMLEMSKVRFSIETGNGSPIISSARQLMIIPSFDGGYTFSKPIFVNLGELGDHTLPVEIDMMQQFRRAVFKIRVTDIINRFTVFSASIDIREAGA